MAIGELGSVGCVLIAGSVWFVRLIPRGHFFWKWYASYFPWNLTFFLLARVCFILLIVMHSCCDNRLVAPLCPYVATFQEHFLSLICREWPTQCWLRVFTVKHTSKLPYPTSYLYTGRKKFTVPQINHIQYGFYWQVGSELIWLVLFSDLLTIDSCNG